MIYVSDKFISNNNKVQSYLKFKYYTGASVKLVLSLHGLIKKITLDFFRSYVQLILRD